MGVQRYEGTCDVCGEAIDMTFNWGPDGMLDYAFTEEGRQFTWRRHHLTPQEGADPGCARYFSRVYEVPWPREAEEPKPQGPHE